MAIKLTPTQNNKGQPIMPMEIDLKTEDGNLSIKTWDWTSPLEHAAAEFVIHSITDQLSEDPPSMSWDPADNDSDIKVRFSLGESFNDNGGSLGPTWVMSIKRTFEDVCDDYDTDDVESMIRSLRSLADTLEAKLKARLETV